MPLTIVEDDDNKPSAIPASKLKPLDVFKRDEDVDDDPVIFMRVLDNDETGIACVPLGCASGSNDVDGIGELESIKPNEKVIVLDAELRFRTR